MISEFAVECRRNQLRRGLLGTSDYGDYSYNKVSVNFKLLLGLLHTHGNDDAEESAHYPVYNPIKLGVASFCAVENPVCVLLLHSQAKQIGFGNNEVEILVKQLRNVFGCARRGSLRCEVFQHDPREGG